MNADEGDLQYVRVRAGALLFEEEIRRMLEMKWNGMVDGRGVVR